MDKAWKAFERTVARAFGTTRTPLSGGNSKQTRADTLHPGLFIECKHRHRIGAVKWFADARELARREGKVPVLAFKEPGRHSFLVLCDVRDLARVAEAIRKDGE